MIDVKTWKYKELVGMCIETIRTPIKQILHCIPENRTPEEQELYDALEIINKYINGGKNENS